MSKVLKWRKNKGSDVWMPSGRYQTRPGPGQLSPGLWLTAEDKTKDPGAPTTCWTMLNKKEAMKNGMLCPDKFFPVSVSPHPRCKPCSPEPAIKPKDASLAPPSGRTEVSTRVASGPCLGEEKGAKVTWTHLHARHYKKWKKTLHQNLPWETAPAVCGGMVFYRRSVVDRPACIYHVCASICLCNY